MTKVAVNHDRTVRYNASRSEVVARLRGRRITGVERHGKFLRLPLDDGQTIVAHLGMSGRWIIDPDTKVPHTHFVATLDNQTIITFVDPRTFGFVAIYDEDDISRAGISRLGPDAWETKIAPSELVSNLSRRTAPIKALLLDQTVIAGLGNIYADEVLFRSRIHPLTPGGGLTIGDVEAVLSSTENVLSAAIENGGTTLDDLAYLLPDGRAGENLDALTVYGRPDEPCSVCGTPIERIFVRARSTYFCPICQALR